MPDFLGMIISKLSMIKVPRHTRCLLSHTGQSEYVYCVLRILLKDPRELSYDQQNLDLMHMEFDLRSNLQSLGRVLSHQVNLDPVIYLLSPTARTFS